MRLLLDESVPWVFRHYMTGHEARTARYMRWDGKDNGELEPLGPRILNRIPLLQRGEVVRIETE